VVVTKPRTPGLQRICIAAALSASAVACGSHKAIPLDSRDSTDTGSADGGLPAVPAVLPVGTPLISDTAACKGGGPSVGPSPLRRISRVEYNAMVHDLLGDTTHPADAFVAESPLANGVNFQANTYTLVTSTFIPQQYLQAAETLAATAVTKNLSAVVSCSAQANDACAQQFIGDFGGRAFRAPVEAEESASLFQLYSDVKAQFDFATGVQAVITAVLTSPRFLFVFEFGVGDPTGGVVALSPYEMAARLALYLWRSVPDATLMQAAASGQLATANQVAAQATRMVQQSPDAARNALEDFATQWLELENTEAVTKDSQYTTWVPALATDLKTESLKTVSSYFLSSGGASSSDASTGGGSITGALADLLTSPSSYVNANVAKFYGVAMPGSLDADGFGLTNVNPDPSHPVREGILTNGSVLATQAHTSLPSPVLRGKLVREQVLCDAMPPPPAGLNIPPPPATVAQGATTRNTFEAHSTNPQCSGCHQYMDPIGLGFGHFDASGQFQATDANGKSDPNGMLPAIDATGAVNPYFTGDMKATFDGAPDLAQQLATSPRVEECFALQEMRYALDRVESVADACSAQQIFQSFSSGGFDLQSLLIAVVRSDSFRYRKAFSPGSSCQ
jgi:hypothetical protein